MMVHRNRESNPQPRPSVAMIPMPMSTSTDYNNAYNNTLPKTNPAARTNAAVGGIDNGNGDYQQSSMYLALEQNPAAYEFPEPNRPLPKQPRPY